MADTADSKSAARKGVWVRIPPRARRDSWLVGMRRRISPVRRSRHSVECDRGGGGDVERVDVGADRNPDANVGPGECFVGQPRSLCAKDQRDPAVGSRCELVDRDGVGRRRERRNREPRATKSGEYRGQVVGARPRDGEHMTDRHPNAAPVERVCARRVEHEAVDAECRRVAEQRADVLVVVQRFADGDDRRVRHHGIERRQRHPLDRRERSTVQVEPDDLAQRAASGHNDAVGHRCQHIRERGAHFGRHQDRSNPRRRDRAERDPERFDALDDAVPAPYLVGEPERRVRQQCVVRQPRVIDGVEVADHDVVAHAGILAERRGLLLSSGAWAPDKRGNYP